MDQCQMLWNSMDRVPLLSTVTLLQMGDRCIGQGDNSFTELYELAIERNNEFHMCLDRYHNQVRNKRAIVFLDLLQITWEIF